MKILMSYPFLLMISFHNLRSFRYWLEILALPFFAFLVFHLAGHGFGIIADSFFQYSLSEFFEKIIGVLLAISFIAIWQLPSLKKILPCSHDHCHDVTKWVHLGAIFAFCIHFFPESIIRAELLHSFSYENIFGFSVLVGFLVHFLVDIIVGFFLINSYKTLQSKSISAACIITVWFVAFFSEGTIISFLPEIGEGFIFIIGAFLLSMFIHLPHQKKECGTCEHSHSKNSSH